MLLTVLVAVNQYSFMRFLFSRQYFYNIAQVYPPATLNFLLTLLACDEAQCNKKK